MNYAKVLKICLMQLIIKV